MGRYAVRRSLRRWANRIGTLRPPETLFEELGFTRDRQIAVWRWDMRLSVAG